MGGYDRGVVEDHEKCGGAPDAVQALNATLRHGNCCHMENPWEARELSS